MIIEQEEQLKKNVYKKYLKKYLKHWNIYKLETSKDEIKLKKLK